MRSILLALPLLLASHVAPLAETCCEEGSPFMLGEAFPKQPATCETIEHWAGRAPSLDARVSMAILGELSAVHWDGVLAYLVMCDEPNMQVLCVTYSTDGREPGDTVLFGGGYMGSNGRIVLLDPCLASER